MSFLAQARTGARNVFKKVKPKTLQIFSRQFATMIEAGLNVVAALVILEEQTDDMYFAPVVNELRADVEGGLLLSRGDAAPSEDLRRASSSRWSRRARRPESSTRCSTASRSRSRSRRRSSAASRARCSTRRWCSSFATLVLDRPADVPRPGLREDLRPARRRAADADAVRRDASRISCAQVVLHLPGRRRRDLRPPQVQEDRERPASSGTASSSRSR